LTEQPERWQVKPEIGGYLGRPTLRFYLGISGLSSFDALEGEMLRRLFLASAMSGVLCLGSAHAADLSPGPGNFPAELDWTGFYVGAFAGGSWQDFRVTNIPTQTSTTTSPTSGVFGGLIGANYQLGGELFGVEGDLGASIGNATSNGNITFPFAQTAQQSWDGRLRGRLGFVLNNALAYFAGGVSFADARISLVDQSATPGAGGAITQTHTGWNLGAGVDYSFTPNLVGRIEYIYDDFGRGYYGFNALTGGHFSNQSLRLSSSTLRVGAIYKFGSN
jgi:outer membrane immunogenic protein